MKQMQDVMVEAIDKLLDFAARKSADRHGRDKEFVDLREKLETAAKQAAIGGVKELKPPKTKSKQTATKSKQTATKSKQTADKPKASSD